MKFLCTLASIALLAHTTILFAPSAPKNSLSADDLEHMLKESSNLVHVAIIGGGPAGLIAAIPPARSDYHVLVFQGPKPGGELIDSSIVENMPGMKKASGFQVMQKLEKQLRSFNAHIVPLSVTHIDTSRWPIRLTLSDNTVIQALTVICATGASQKKLGIDGEDTYYGKGVFSCGLCDATFTKDKDTIVVGGSDIAIQRALQLVPEAQKITIIVPGSRMTAHESMQRKISDIPKISVLYNKSVVKICGDSNAITHVELRDSITNSKSTLTTSSIFLSTGLTPNTELFKQCIPLDSYGCIKLKEGRTQETLIDGILAAGTVADPHYRQVGVICGDATRAGMDALNLLAKWGFDGSAREKTKSYLYKPLPIPHPAIKQLLSLGHFKKALKKDPNVLVEFYSPLCPSCKKMEGILSAVTEDLKKDVRFYQADKDKLFALIRQHNVHLLPAFIFYLNGKEVNRIEGETNFDALKGLITKALDIKKPKKAGRV